MAPNIDFNKYLNNAGIGNYNLNSFLGTASTQSGGSSYDDIAWFANAIGVLQGGDDAQKVNVFTSMAEKVLGIFSDLGTRDAVNATKDVKQDDKKIDENKKDIEKTYEQLNDKLQDILDKCNENRDTVEAALRTIDEIGGDKGKIKEKEEELEAQVKIIDEAKEKLNNKDTKPEERANAISAILGAVGVINGLVEEVNGFKTQISEQQDIVTAASDEIEEYAGKMQGIVSEGVQETQALAQEVTKLTAEETQTQVDGLQKTTLGSGQVATGEAMQSSLFGSAMGTKLVASGTSKISGGKTLMVGAINGYKELASNATDINSGFQYFTNFAQGIGEFGQGIQDLVGAFNANVDPMITSIGTWESVAEGNRQLEEYIADYSQKVGFATVDNKGDVKNGDDNNASANANGKDKSDKEVLQSNQQNKDIKYEQFDFDTSILKLKKEKETK